MTYTSETDVLIVGAGPTGLSLACVLAEQGVPFVLLDRQAEGANTSRAAVIHARTLEVLEQLKVTQRLHREGHIVPRFSIRDRDRALASIHFENLPTAYPHTLMIPQQRTEAILLERLQELGGEVTRPVELTALHQVGDKVFVTVQGSDAKLHTIKARFLIGADGMHSTVRKFAGIPFSGSRYEQSFVLADVHMDWSMRRDEVMLFFSPEGLVVIAPLPEGQHRIVATMDTAPEFPDIDDVQQLLDRRGPVKFPAKINNIVWSSRFRLHHRLADRFRAGQVFLAGDAAHTHSPAGGQGMNTGIQDAIVLGKLLCEVITKHADPAVLNHYERIRRPVAKRVVGFTDRMTRIATIKHPGGRLVRNKVLSIVGRIPQLPNKLALELSGLRNRLPLFD